MSHTVLVIEDDEDLNHLLQFSLKRAGYHVIQAWDGNVAMDAIRHEQPDLILLDLMLPAADGWLVFEALKGKPWIDQVPVIVVTSSSDRADIERARRMGARDYFVKPFGIATLLQSIERALAARRDDLEKAHDAMVG